METILDDFHDYIVLPHVIEKLYVCSWDLGVDIDDDIQFKYVQLLFTIMNLKVSKLHFLCLLLLVEKYEAKIGLPHTHEITYEVFTTRMDNLKVVLTLRGSRFYRFFHNFTFYSFKKYRALVVMFNHENVTEEMEDKINEVGLCLNRIMFFFNISSSLDYSSFATYVVDAKFYMMIKFVTNYGHKYMSKLLLSHYGIDILY